MASSGSVWCNARPHANAAILIVILIVLTAVRPSQAQSVGLGISSASAGPGSSVTVNLSSNAAGPLPASVDWTLDYSTVDFGSASLAAGPAATAAAKQLSCSSGTGTATCVLWGLNDNTIANGVLATITLPVNYTSDASSQLQLANTSAAVSTGAPLATSATAGIVTIAPGLSGFTCTPVAFAPPASSSCTVTLSAAAPAGGATVPLTASPASAVILPASITFPQGSLTGAFTVTGGKVGSSTAVMLTASYLGAIQGFGITLNPSAAPSVSGLSPTSGVVGTAVTIAGTNFGATAGASTVTFNGTVATPTNWSASSIIVPVPAGATSGNVTVTVGGVASNGVAFTVLPQPSAVSVSPSSGSGTTQTFTFVFSDSQNAANMTGLGMLFSSSPTAVTNSCYLIYDGTAQTLGLYWNNMQGQNDRALSSQAVLQNRQCAVGAATFTTAGLTTTITVNITFESGFAGTHNIYMYASDYAYGLNTGLVQRGTFTAVSGLAQPSAVSVTPSSGSGTSQTFTFVYSDSENVANMTGLGMLFSSSPTALTNSCNLIYDRTSQTLGLYWNNMLGQSDRPLSSQTMLENSQCAVGAATFTAVGLTMTVTVNITFQGAFDGPTNIYMYASDYAYGVNTGWVQRGTFTAAAPGTPVVNSVVPASGSGTAQSFGFTVSDPGGASLIWNVSVLFASTLNEVNACYLVWDGTAQTISLGYQNPASGETPGTLGSSGTISNSQCSLSLANSTIAYSGNNLTLTLNLSFSPSFDGAKNIYVYKGAPGYNSGWVTAGTWTVNGG